MMSQDADPLPMPYLILYYYYQQFCQHQQIPLILRVHS